jgi:hypothetical protein
MAANLKLPLTKVPSNHNKMEHLRSEAEGMPDANFHIPIVCLSAILMIN